MNEKEQTRALDDAVARFLAQGGKVLVLPEGMDSGRSGKDWSRIVKGEKVASAQEIEDERNRRALLAVKNADAELIVQLLAGRFDAEIKFDIESDRLGPNGEIR